MNVDQVLLPINRFKQQIFLNNSFFYTTKDDGKNIIAEDTLLDLNQEPSQMTDPYKLFFDLQKLLEK